MRVEAWPVPSRESAAPCTTPTARPPHGHLPHDARSARALCVLDAPPLGTTPHTSNPNTHPSRYHPSYIQP